MSLQIAVVLCPYVYTTCSLEHKQYDKRAAFELPTLSVTSEENGRHVSMVYGLRIPTEKRRILTALEKIHLALLTLKCKI